MLLEWMNEKTGESTSANKDNSTPTAGAPMPPNDEGDQKPEAKNSYSKYKDITKLGVIN